MQETLGLPEGTPIELRRRDHLEWPDDEAGKHLPTVASMQPLHQFILKIHERCNLACDYCYIYEMADQSWQGRPRKMPREVLQQTAVRIAEHVDGHQIKTIEVVLHGGEPLLAGAEFCGDAAIALRRAMPGVIVNIVVQTNGVLLSRDLLETFREHQIGVGVSIDGDEAGHDKHRRFANGRGSYHQVVKGLALLLEDEFRHLFRGLLCTIDLGNDPITTYEALLEWQPPAVDFLLPHGNWSQPPPGRDPTSDSTPYADWLIKIFDRWCDVPVRETDVRLFSEIIGLSVGAPSGLELIGCSPIDLVVIETDGSFEQVDTLKSAFEGAASTGANVWDHSIDSILHFPAIAARRAGVLALCDTCRNCPIVEVCGGGYYPHRYRRGSGFFNPSVYCSDLFRLIHYIGARVVANLATRS